MELKITKNGQLFLVIIALVAVIIEGLMIAALSAPGMIRGVLEFSQTDCLAFGLQLTVFGAISALGCLIPLLKKKLMMKPRTNRALEITSVISSQVLLAEGIVIIALSGMMDFGQYYGILQRTVVLFGAQLVFISGLALIELLGRLMDKVPLTKLVGLVGLTIAVIGLMVVGFAGSLNLMDNIQFSTNDMRFAGFHLILIGAMVLIFGWLDTGQRNSIQRGRLTAILILLTVVAIEGLVIASLPGDVIIQGQFVVDRIGLKISGLVVVFIGLIGILTTWVSLDRIQRRMKRPSILAFLFFLLMIPMALIS